MANKFFINQIVSRLPFLVFLVIMYVDSDRSYQHIDLRATSSIENYGNIGYSRSFEEMITPSVCSFDTTVSRFETNHGARRILEYLILNPTSDLTWSDYDAFFDACSGGHTSIVSAFLSHPDIDPMIENNKPIMLAILSGKTKVVEILLRDYRVDPTKPDNAPLIVASEFGHTDIVKFLLLNVNVDPSADHCAALIWAAGNGYTEVLEALCDDPRVDLSTWHPRTYDWFSASTDCPPSARSRNAKRSLYLRWKEHDATRTRAEVYAGYESQCDIFSMEIDLIEAHTALHWAVRNCHEDTVKFLLQRYGDNLPSFVSIRAFCTDMCMKLVLEEMYQPRNKGLC